jgi:glycosyltransferase involved in cell wall biosynthesis
MANQSYRILMVAPTPFFADRGCHVRILEEARALQSIGHQVVVVTYHNGRNVPGIDVRRIPNIPWYKKLEAGPSIHKCYLDQLLLARAVGTSLTFKPDILHGHLHEGALAVRLLAAVYRAPSLMDCQGSLTDELVAHRALRRGSLAYRFMWALERAIVRSMDAVIVSSAKTGEFLTQKLGLPRSKLRIVMDGADTNEFRPDRNTNNLRQRLGISPDIPVVVYMGALTPYQGIDLLLDAVPLVLAKHPNAVFLILGYPEQEYKRRAESAGLSDNVIFTGRVSYFDTADYLAIANVAVAPKLSTTEANGKVFYYMASGLPTVVFEQPVNRDMLGDYGLYAAMGDHVSLAEKINLVLGNPDLAKRLSEGVRRLAVEKYSWTRAAREITSVYDVLLNRSISLEEQEPAEVKNPVGSFR